MSSQIALGTRVALPRVDAARAVTSALVIAAVLFFALPLIALVSRVSPAAVVEQLATSEARTAVLVSVTSVLAALVAVVAFGTPVAYLLAHGSGRHVRALEVLFDIPLVLPPAVAGIALLAAFGESGLIGEPLADAGLQVAFTRLAVVIALAFVAGPLYVHQARTAFAALDRSVLEAARVAGGSPWRNFVRVELPLARAGIATGAILCSARALGEFGATMMFAGSVVGVTQTITLAIYGSLETEPATAYALATLLLALTVAMSFVARVAMARRGQESLRD